MTVPEESSPQEKQIHLHLDGKDFEGFTFRLLEVALPSILITWLTGWDGGAVFFIMIFFWIIFLIYKISMFKESAYRQIINDLEAQNAKLDKSNKLLQNVVQDKLGMKVSLEDKHS